MLSENIDFLKEHLSFYEQLSEPQRELTVNNTRQSIYKKDDIIAGGAADCAGLMLLKEGQARVFMMSAEGKEITLYRLLPGDACIMTSSCLNKNLDFDVFIGFEKDSKVLFLPPAVLERLKSENKAFEAFVLDLVSRRFSEVMWVMEKVVFTPVLSRLCGFLAAKADLEGTDTLKITHSEAANDLGTAREVVSRLLKYLQSEGAILQARGEIKIVDRKLLKKFL